MINYCDAVMQNLTQYFIYFYVVDVVKIKKKEEKGSHRAILRKVTQASRYVIQNDFGLTLLRRECQ